VGKPIKSAGGEEASRECPDCHSRRNWKDGVRQTLNGEVQRFLCRVCGYRFSESSVKVNVVGKVGESFDSGKNHDEVGVASGYASDKKVDDCLSFAFGEDVASHNTSIVEKGLNGLPFYNSSHQVCAQKDAKNLNTATETKTVAGESQKITQDTKGKILEFAWHLKKQNSSDSTIRTFTFLLKKLAENGADLDEPESVKEVLSKLSVSPNSKALIVATYTSFLKFQKRSWIPPKYKRQDKIPFIPQEAEIDALISGCSRTISALLLLLKETGMRIGEACRLKWTDINAENNTVAVNEPEKGSNARIIRVSDRLIRVIGALPKKCEKVFGKSNKTDKSHSYQRQRIWLSKKLSNPRLQKITFHTLRHWKATMEYHKTKDIVHVQRLLGHRNIQNTLRYINLEQAIFKETTDQFHVKVVDSIEDACKLIEVGYEFVLEMNGKKLFRKIK
jgi:integrase